MTAGTMTLGLAVAALVGPRWPWTFRVAQIIGAAAPLAAIVNTVAAGFDQPSTIALTTMHVVIAIATPAAIETMRRRANTAPRAVLQEQFAE